VESYGVEMRIYDGDSKCSFDSPYELDFAHQLKAFGLEFKPQFSFDGDRHRYDFYIFELKAVVEINGGVWVKSGHSSGTGITRDYRKINLASTYGVRTFCFTPDMVTDGEAIETIRKALAWQNKYKGLTKDG